MVAPDRGFVGNNETLSVYKNFEKSYISEILFIGRTYDGLNSNYSKYIQEALTSLNKSSVSNIVILPLFISKDNHILQMVKKHILNYEYKGNIYWNETMSESYLTAQMMNVWEKPKYVLNVGLVR